DARYDGKWVLRTNTALPPSEVARAYKGLWQVEEAFRVLKTPLELRPIYHWTEARVRGHVTVCFLAFVLRQLLRTRLDTLGWEGSFTEPLASLGRVRATVLRGKGGQTFRLRDEIPARAMPALHAVGMRAPRRLERLD
ncbi:transposase, partial [Candidatus Bipolaricaulota bacterium]|nr:transposase [Candidatus Bipolaricaulota bacterium]